MSEAHQDYEHGKHVPAPTVLTDREIEIMDLLVEGYQDKEIADALHIALPTAKNHVSHILTKMDMHNRTEAAVAYAMGGLEWI